MNGLYEEFRIAVHSVWQRRWIAMGIAWVICLVGWLAVAMIPNTYESQAKLFVQTKSILPENTGVNPAEQQKQIDTVQQTLTSAANLEKVVRGTDLGKGLVTPREIEGAVNGLRSAIKIKSEQSNLFEISATMTASGRSDGEAANLSRAVVQKLIDLFVEENLAGGRGETSDTLRFLNEQIAKRQKELEIAEQKRVKFETENLGMLPGIGSVSQRLEQGRVEINQIDSQLIAAQSALAAINGQIAGTPQTIAGGTTGAVNPLAQAQGELAGMKARGLTDQHPDVQAIKNQIAALKAAGAGASTAYGVPNPAYSSLVSMKAERQAAVSALQQRKASLQGEMNAMVAKQIQEPGVAAEQARIARDYEVLKAQYDKLLADREQVRLRGQVETQTDAVRFDLITPPSSPRTPIAPKRPLLLAAVLFAGIAGGIGGAFALGQLSASYPTSAKLEAASGLPVIGSISQMLTQAQRDERKRKLRMYIGSGGALVGVFLVLLIIEFIQRGSVV
ncbi:MULTISPECIES: XrtA system polysaccharide chain length determinant [Pseudomonadota]|jgi:polysaccharide chain length determinant protein (PEP-CTERM system associated)|uniref:XrtA system polysaccharide chain length determinant n=1 Tax=Pseudomonadota TaxID=1224 RepID=UPI000769B4F7|nr:MULTISPECIES: XrtA system polysaccharide chain length determinant [Pseudomonadota]MAF63471.1 chain-length determining protein [Blastomonas sp.]|tara:strand:+ start:26828 stop:28342 length:1515 start_codon:yes stop_codon:yes gene_type:complete